MSESVFRGVELVGTSDRSFSHAIEVAISRARRTLRGLSWFVVQEQRGGLQQGRLEYQVTLRVFFKLEDGDKLEEAGGGAEAGGAEIAVSATASQATSARKKGRKRP